MMQTVNSMTAFARQVGQYSWGTLVWELRSVNHRFCEFSLFLPEPLRMIEMVAQTELKKQVTRGKIEARLKYTQSGKPLTRKLNQALLTQLAEAGDKIALQFGPTVTNVADVLNWPDMWQVMDDDWEAMAAESIVLLQKTINLLVIARQQEGQELKNLILNKATQIISQLNIIAELTPAALAHARERLVARFAELNLVINQERLEQEIVFLTQKSDITEELERLNVHLATIRQILSQGGDIGRRLDFLAQELHREVNTLSSKSSQIAIIQAAVAIKVSVEQIREQVQNIE